MARNLIVAKAYVDQLERSQALPTAQITSLRRAIQTAESSRMSKASLAKLKSFAPLLEEVAYVTRNAADASRLRALAEILKQPAQ